MQMTTTTGAARARVRSITQMINTQREKQGPYSVFSRLRAEAIPACAESIARTHPSENLNIEDLRRCLSLREGQYPAAFLTTPEVSASVRSARHEAMKPI